MSGPFVVRKAEALEPFMLRLRVLHHQGFTATLSPCSPERDFRIEIKTPAPARRAFYADGDDPNSVLDQIEADLVAKGFEFEGSRAFLARL